MVSDSRRQFDDGLFSEPELRAIKRMLPTAYYACAQTMNRKSFLYHVAMTMRNGPRLVGTLRNTFYSLSMGLSKRDENP